MRRLVLFLALVLGPALYAQETPVSTPDRVSSATLDGLADVATVSLQGRGGAGVIITTANLNATVIPEVSYDGGTTFTAARFISPAGVVAASLAFAGGSDTQAHGILTGPGASHVRVRVSVYASGTSTAVIRATSSPQAVRETQPVSVAALPLPSGAATAAEQATQTASLSVLDDWDSNDRAKTSPIAGQDGVAAGAGDSSALTQRVVEAGAATIAYGQVSCTTSATQVAAARAGRRAISVTLVAGGTDIYLGDASVATTTGELLLGAKGASRSIPTSAALYCRTGSGSVTLSFTEVY